MTAPKAYNTKICLIVLDLKIVISTPLITMVVLAPCLHTLGEGTRTPIAMSGHFSPQVLAKSPSNPMHHFKILDNLLLVEK